jgi:hypothetical protein
MRIEGTQIAYKDSKWTVGAPYEGKCKILCGQNECKHDRVHHFHLKGEVVVDDFNKHVEEINT